ncbi:DUF3309 family protein [Legionella impletisoli]|uniref:DUF3309 family protein n=1 Tax=Legionella impletisoli TaxID=343510 RepID=UPI0010417F4B|nr:DUF3309 family protein [Legionella impletisoli]
MDLIGIIVLLLLISILLPIWPYSRGWGYKPSGIITILLIILILYLLLRPGVI